MSDTTLFIRSPEVWKGGILPEEIMDEQEAKSRAEEIEIRRILEEETEKLEYPTNEEITREKGLEEAREVMAEMAEIRAIESGEAEYE
jgi:hypothetical protein